MISPEASTLVTLVVYALAAGVGIAGMTARSPGLRRIGCLLAAVGFICQTLMLTLGFHSAVPGGLSLGAYLQMPAWFVMLCGLGYFFFLKQETPVLFAAPLALLLFAMSLPYLSAVVLVPPSLKAPFYAFHIGALFLSIGLLAFACAAGALFLFLEGRIKSKQQMKGFWQDMPALGILDKINAVTVTAAFPLYTLGLAAGFIWAKPIFGDALSGDPKEVISIVIWLLLSVLFNNRVAKSWKGRKPARLAIFIFVLCVFSIAVVNTFMESHHAFTRR